MDLAIPSSLENPVIGFNDPGAQALLTTLDANRADLRLHQAQLATGRRLTSASVDAASLAISEQLEASTRSSGRALANLGDAQSALATAEGGLGTIGELQKRATELAVQGANGTLSASGRAAIAEELNQIENEINRIATTTEFAGAPLLDGSQPTLEVAAGPDAGDTIAVALPTVADGTADAAALDPNDPVTFGAYLDGIQGRFEATNDARARLGATTNRLQSAADALTIQRANEIVATSRLRDADVAQVTADLARTEILSGVGLATLDARLQSRQALGGLLGG